MIELPLIFLGGLLGSAHCIGMCGGFALAVGSGAPTLASNVRRQLIYSSGRIFTYSFGGAAAGFGGWHLSSALPPLIHVQAVLAVVAGVLLIVQGLLAAGYFPRLSATTGAAPCLASRFFPPMLTGGGVKGVFVAGLFTGFLPCGLVYAYLALAVATGSLLWGLCVMALFGAGTVPIMVLTGSGGSLISLATRRHLFRAAAWCVVLTGVLSLSRGVMFFGHDATPGTPCPMCIDH